LDNINIEIKFKIATLCGVIGFTIGLIIYSITKDPNNLKDSVDLGLPVVLGIFSGIMGFSVIPWIIFEFSNPYRKLYLIIGPIGIAFVKLSIKVFTADGKLTKKEIAKFVAYMQKEFGESILEPLLDYISENKKIEEDIITISRPMIEIKLADRIDVISRLFLMVMIDRIYNENEETVLKKIARSLKIGVRRFEMIKNNILVEKGYQTKSKEERSQKSKSWNFYVMDQLLKMAYNPFVILGIEQNATNEELKNAYRRLVKKYHPDKSMQKDDETRKLDAVKILEINEAYESIKKMRGIK
jgi:DnaJ like chaperone protein